MPGDPSWDVRFDAVLAAADDLVVIDPARPGELDPEFFDYVNRVALGSAIRRARELDCELRVIALWDGTSGPKGGTSDVVRLARAAGVPVEIVPPILRGEPAILSEVATAGQDGTMPHLLRLGLFAIVCGPMGDGNFPASIFEKNPASDFITGEAHFFAYFETAGAALAFARTFPSSKDSIIALHYGPVTWSQNPVTGRNSPGGRHASRALEIHELCPTKGICTSAEFAAQAAIEGINSSFVYLGRAATSPGKPERQLFRLGYS